LTISARASSVTLAWNAVTNAGVAGYNTYTGPVSLQYTNVVFAGNNTNVTIFGLYPGSTYYFAVTTLASSGLESGYSTEIAYTVPYTNYPPFFVTTNYLLNYVIQLTVRTDMIDWNVIKFTNSFPGYPARAGFRLTSFGSNVWQYQAASNLNGPWSNVIGTMKSSRVPRLGMYISSSNRIGTNYSTNNPYSTNDSSGPVMPPFLLR
jgi:hypothetical protein